MRHIFATGYKGRAALPPHYGGAAGHCDGNLPLRLLLRLKVDFWLIKKIREYISTHKLENECVQFKPKKSYFQVF